ncbi:hypothetical protein CEXT_588311 [Caerostris extrusa]|uniref:Uncharacterized protein n=1 Tax=Caerostris extrusa TaxID=172846 RepID=A0AAV4NNH9_CAEEX|nr:hypothetical protein CEXT_588311 [Caerostris extrusa]
MSTMHKLSTHTLSYFVNITKSRKPTRSLVDAPRWEIEMFSNAYEGEQFLSFLPRHNRKKPARPGIVTICNQKCQGKENDLFICLPHISRLLFFISSLEVGIKVFRSLPYSQSYLFQRNGMFDSWEISSICC